MNGELIACVFFVKTARISNLPNSRHTQEYPSDPLRKISALQTKVELAGNLSNKQNLAEN